MRPKIEGTLGGMRGVAALHGIGGMISDLTLVDFIWTLVDLILTLKVSLTCNFDATAF